MRSDAYWWEAEFAREHDPTGLACEANRFRYRRFARAILRIAADAPPYDVARVRAAVWRSGSRFDVSAAPGRAAQAGWRCESTADFAARVLAEAPERIRLLGGEPSPGLGVVPYVDRRPPVDDGRIELARYLREQAVSATRHRFGSLAPELAP